MNLKHLGVPEDSKSPTLGVSGFNPTLGQSGVVTLKMGRPDFGELVAALKTGAAKGERFQPAKPGNFDGARDRKVVDAWLAEMDDYLHAAKVGRNFAVELAQSYLKGNAATWWRTV